EAQTAVFAGDLHAEGPETAELFEDLFGVFARRVDPGGVGAAQQVLHGGEEGGELGPVGLGQRVRVDQVEAEATQEEFPHEARLGPLRLPGGLGDLERLPFRDLRGLGHCVHYLPSLGGAASSQAARSTFQVPPCSTTCRSKRYMASGGSRPPSPPMLSARPENSARK